MWARLAGKGWLLRFFLAFVLAYPLTGIVVATLAILGNPSIIIHDPSLALLAFVLGSVWFGVFTPLYGGFPISDEGGINHTNMYPYIIPISIVLFLLFSRPWRGIKR